MVLPLAHRLAALGSGATKVGTRPREGESVVDLGGGVVWLHCTTTEPSSSSTRLLSTSVVAAAKAPAGETSAQRLVTEVEDALLNSKRGDQEDCGQEIPPAVQILVPETMASLDYCRWTGDGHFNYKKYAQKVPPTLGQLVAFLRMVEASEDVSMITIHLSSEEHLAEGAVLAGAVLVVLRGMAAGDAWARIRHSCPPPGSDPTKAWDRFPASFSKTSETTATSLTVFDCLAGLEMAQSQGWFAYKGFDIAGWRALRQKFDATWVIPGKMLALGEPSTTSENPAYPGLLEPAVKAHSESNISDSTVASESEAESPTFMDFFNMSGIRRIVRLNRKKESSALRRGIDHEAVFGTAGLEIRNFEFEDGTAPPAAVAGAFTKESEEYSGALAVHCMQGLGRTGTIIGAYALAHHKVSGESYHGWVRMCRPGSIQTTTQERFLRSYRKSSIGVRGLLCSKACQS